MSVQLATLAARLERAVPRRNGQPDDYDQLVQDAVAQLGRDVPMISSATLTIVAGTEAYTLPADFQIFIGLDPLATPGGVNLSSGRIMVVPGDFTERVYVEGDKIRFELAPTYSASRLLRYGAGYTLVQGAWARLSENGARIALMYAQHLALMAQAADAATGAWKYQIGDEMVDKSKAGSALSDQADGFHKQYQAAVRQLRGYGQTARYGSTGEAAWA